MTLTTVATEGLRIQPIEHVATQIGISCHTLIETATNATTLYHEFDKHVKGKQRHLTMAQPRLASLQRRILDRLLCRLPVSDHAFGAIKGRGIRDNAQAHAAASYIVKLDIRDFYPSIRAKKVYDFFMAQHCSPDVSRLLTLLTTYKHSLPLGAATSPFLADQIVSPIDRRIGGLAKANRLTYTRYVDDVTISGHFDLERITRKIIDIIRQAGFAIKRSKLEFYRPHDGKEKIITGVRVENGNVSAPLSYVETLTQELLSAREASRHEHPDRPFDERNQYRGRIGYVMWLDAKAGRKLLRIYRQVKWRHLEWAVKQGGLASA